MNKPKMWVIVVSVAAIAAFFLVRIDIVKRHRPRNADVPHESAGKATQVETVITDRLVTTTAKTITGSDLIAVLKKALHDGNEQEIRQIVRTLKGKDLDDAVAVVMETRPGWMMVRTFFSAWADGSPEACAKWVAVSMPKCGDRSYVMQYAIGRWVMRNPREALAWAGGLREEQGRDGALLAVFKSWASLDPESAAKELSLVKDFDSRNLAEGAIAYCWARKDVRAATAWAWNLSKDSGYDYALSNIARVLYETDKAGGSEWVRSFPAGYTNNPTLCSLAAFLTGRDSGQAVSRLAERIPGGPGPAPELQMQISRWAAKDPGGATAWAAHLPDERGREQALCTIACVLASVDPVAAAKVAESMPAGTMKNSAVSKVASAWASTDSIKAAEWAKQLPQDGTSQSAQEAVTSVTAPAENAGTAQVSIPEILNQDLSVAVGLAEQLPDGKQRDAVMHSIALRWAEADPAAAAAWVIQEMPDGLELNSTLRAIVWDWTAKDSAGALAWTGELGDQARQADTMATIAMALAKKDPRQAVAVADKVPAGEARNNVVANIAFQWAHVDRNAATAWAESLSTEQGKEQALDAIRRAQQ